MFSKFNEEAQKILVLAKKEMTELKHPYVGSEHLLLAILSKPNCEVTKKLASYKLTYQAFKEEIIKVIGLGNEALYTPLLKRVMETAILDSKENNDGEVSVEHLFLAMLEEGEGVAIRILLGMNIDVDAIYNDFSTKLVPKKGKGKKKLFIEEFAVDFNKRVISKEIDPVIGREDEINRLIEILSRRTKNNPLLIGEAGVGKTAIVEELSRRIVEGNVPSFLQGKRILSLSMASMVAGTKYRGEFEERVGKILKEVENDGDIILFIDEIHTLVGAGGAEGAIDASNILKPALARGKLRLIGATTTMEYKECIEKDRALERRFQLIDVVEPTKEKTYAILLNLKSIYESFHGVQIEDDILKLIVELSDKYMYDRKQPDKAIDILDEVCVREALKKNKDTIAIENINLEIKKLLEDKNKAIINQDFEMASMLKRQEQILEDRKNRLELASLRKKDVRKVTKDMVAEVIHLKTKIPVYELLGEDVKNLQELEKKLNDRVIGREKIINRLCNITKKIQLGYHDKKRPYSFLFVGPTGVGKTLLVKEYAKMLFGEDNFIRLDMSEFKESHTVSKIIGSPPGYVGYNDHKNILEEVRAKPYSIILLDEIEKADSAVLHLFLQILDEGKIKDAQGNIVRFDHTIIFMTSNMGYQNNHLVGFSKSDEQVTITKLKEYFSMEFINRIDEVFTFAFMSRKEAEEIVKLKLKKVKTKFQNKGIQIAISQSLIKQILDMSQYEEFGARRIDRVISDKIDTIVIDKILEGKKKIRISQIV